MLPDFPEIKRKLWVLREARMQKLKREHNRSLSQATVFDVEEGHRVVGIDNEGTRSVVPIKSHSSDITLTFEEFENLTQDEIEEKFNFAARDIATQAEQQMIEILDRSAESSGNVIQQVGPFSHKAYLNALEKVDIWFDEMGNPELPTILCGPEMGKKMLAVFAVPLSVEDEKRRKSIIDRKREAWRDREDSRKLVD